MAYIFVNIHEAISHLNVHGFTVGEVFTNWITPLRTTSKRANLFFEANEVGYLETPTDLQPDEQWVVNIPLHKRYLIPEGILNAVFGDNVINEGWENRQFYLESAAYTRFNFGLMLENNLTAKGPSSSFSLRSMSEPLKLYLKNTFEEENEETGELDIRFVNSYAAIELDYPKLAHELRFAFADIMGKIAVERPNPIDFDKLNSEKGWVIGIDQNFQSKWMPIEDLDLTYIESNFLRKDVGGTISQPVFLTYSITSNNHAVNKKYVDDAIFNKKRMFLIGNDVDDTYQILHGLNDINVVVYAYDNITQTDVSCIVKRVNTNNIEVKFSNIVLMDSITVVVIRF